MLCRSVTPSVYALSVSLQDNRDDSVYVQKRRNYFNLFLADYLMAHLSPLWIDNSIVKFTGDTWLLMTESRDDVAGLCGLAVLLSKKFATDLVSATGIPIDRLPDIKLAVTAERGRRVNLPGGHHDWIVKGTTLQSLSGDCGVLTGKAVVDETVYEAVADTFSIESFAVNNSCYKLNSLKEEAITRESDGRERFLYLSSVLVSETTSETQDVVLELCEGLIRQVMRETDQGTGIDKDTKSGRTFAQRFNTLIAALSDYELGLKLLDGYRNAGGHVLTDTYVYLIDKARDYDALSALTDRMSADGVVFDSIILTSLAAKSPDYMTVKSWFELADLSAASLGHEAYDRCIMKAPDYVIANSIYDKMLACGAIPEVATYNALVSKSPDYETAKAWLNVMLDEDLLPNLFIYNRVIAKSPDYDTALEVFNEISVAEIKPNAITYNTLISRAPDYEMACSWIDIMNDHGVRPNVDSFVRLFSRDIGSIPAKDLLATYLVWELQSEEPVQTAISTYQKNGRIDQALYLAVDYPHLPSARKLIREIMSEVMTYLEEIKNDEVMVSLASYNNLIESAPFYATATSWLSVMKEHGVEPNATTYRALIEKAPDFEATKSWIEKLQLLDAEPGNDSYAALFSKNLASVSAEELIAWFRAQAHHSDEPIGVAMLTYRNLGMASHALKTALEYPHLREARDIIKEHVNLVFSYLKTVCEESSLVDIDAYTELIAKAPYYDVAESWLDIMRSKGMQPNVTIYNTLLAKAPNYDTVRLLLDAMSTERIEPNIVTFGTLIARSPDFPTAKHWSRIMCESDMKPNVVTYSALISKAPDYESAKMLLDEMKLKGVKPNVISYNAVMSCAPDYLTAKDLIDEMFRQKTQPNVVTFNRLFSKNLSDIRADDLASWYKSLKYHPDDPIQAAISTFRKLGLMEDARCLAAHYPALAISKKVMAENDFTTEAVLDLGGSARSDTVDSSGSSLSTEVAREYIETAKKSAMMKQCLRIMDGELASTVGI